MTSPSDRVEFGIAEATAFLRGGGRVGGILEWMAMPEEVRGALAVAGELLDRERAVMTAVALRNEAGAAEVASLADGGAWRLRLQMAEACESALNEIRGGAA